MLVLFLPLQREPLFCVGFQAFSWVFYTHTYMDRPNIWGIYYTLFLLFLLNLAADSFKVLEAKRAINYQKLGTRKSKFYLLGDINDTYYSLIPTHKKSHILRRAKTRQLTLLRSTHRVLGAWPSGSLQKPYHTHQSTSSWR